MTTDESSFSSVVFTTNIPGDKEHILDPNNISYSDNPNLKLINVTSKLYYYSNKIINPSTFSNNNRAHILNVLFNKNRFNKIPGNNFVASPISTREDIITNNVMSYIENIFTTFPKSSNIKKTSIMNDNGGLKWNIPFTSIPYTYLNVNGTMHTVSRVVYYDDKNKDKVTTEIINDNVEFEKWYSIKTSLKFSKRHLLMI